MVVSTLKDSKAATPQRHGRSGGPSYPLKNNPQWQGVRPSPFRDCRNQMKCRSDQLEHLTKYVRPGERIGLGSVRMGYGSSPNPCHPRYFIQKLMNWRHSGFSVYAGNRIARDDKASQEALGQYIMRNAFAEEKITYIEDTGQVLYRSDMTHGKNKKNFELLPAEEFIARVTQQIPEKGFQMVR